MALREFMDRQGVQWRVWDVTPEGMNPATVRELFLGEFEEGWLAFESGTLRRRLARWPKTWAQMSDEELERLCERATLVTRRSPTGAGVERTVAETQGRDTEATTSSASVTFAGADGRHWMVTPVETEVAGEKVTVLRFACADGTLLDLDEFPDDWVRFTAPQLADMARRARAPRATPGEGKTGRPEQGRPR